MSSSGSDLIVAGSDMSGIASNLIGGDSDGSLLVGGEAGERSLLMQMG